ncbi:MAG: hypothetical protein A3C88_02485 [Candidatus Yanofskybacteria bacterium RIFCSPHIGHO2_02_FULL_50_12]|uniref:Uncharacterized protein n=1 Tax=Candidatus Yanofskybacteria bacterium RIFCSPHIGHO2_02_FULL_50_12 TaxID=1802685 RepID=A0A1F8FVI3_9BACT|nr:MAG: hypothetical protein A3C88_02485 [Candidatus Yanofskybacteria bacterium RIFCSPHIGHO2_02_FULL_50_12]
MSNPRFELIQRVLQHPDQSKILSPLGLTAKEGEIFWAALSAVPESGELTIPNFRKLASKVASQPSVYMIRLRRKGLLSNSERGVWEVTTKAITRLRAITEGREPQKEKVKRTVRTKTRSRRTQKHLRVVTSKFDLQKYARMGAKKRITEIITELKYIYHHFPELRQGRRIMGRVKKFPNKRRKAAKSKKRSSSALR